MLEQCELMCAIQLPGIIIKLFLQHRLGIYNYCTELGILQAVTPIINQREPRTISDGGHFIQAVAVRRQCVRKASFISISS